MSKKVKIISIIIITIIMIIGVKFGGKDEQYIVDFEINRLHTQVSDSIAVLEANPNTESEKLQEDILKSREFISEFEKYTEDNNQKEYYLDTLTSWSVRVDNFQQIVITRVVDSIARAKQVGSVKTIDEAKRSIPSNMPSKWKEDFEKDVNTIKPYEGLSD